MKKNEQRIVVHLVDKSEFDNGRIRYKCNWAIEPNASRITNDISLVTCKCCLRLMGGRQDEKGIKDQ